MDDNDRMIKNVQGVNTAKYRLNSTTETILLLFFILSLLSIFIALMIVAISIQASPLPDFPLVMVENMWKFFFVIPLPLSSLILGIIYFPKGYKCKKNIIGGIIMTILLFIYGNFTNIFENSFSHDMDYLIELSEKVNIDFPQDGYISIAYDFMENCESIAMIKFDNAEKLENKIKYDRKWKEMSNMPSHLIDPFLAGLTSDYDYYLTYDVETNSYDYLGNKVIYLSYDMETDTLFICQYK